MMRLAALLWLVLAWPAAAAEPRYPIPVTVSVPPQAYFVERIAGPYAQVTVMIPPGVEPETYAPSPRQMVALAGARLYVEVGHPGFLFERKYVDPYLRAHPRIAVVNMSRGIDYLSLPAGAAEPGTGTGAGNDPHVWVAPYTVRIAARHIADALARIDPAHASYYEHNLARFLADTDALDRDIRQELTGLQARRFLVFHPAWGYFAHEYGLEQVAISADDKEPSPAQLIRLIEEARREGIKVVFVQKGFSTRGAEVIARAIGGRVLEIDPLAQDWPANLRRVAATFHQVLSDERHPAPR